MYKALSSHWRRRLRDSPRSILNGITLFDPLCKRYTSDLIHDLSNNNYSRDNRLNLN